MRKIQNSRIATVSIFLCFSCGPGPQDNPKELVDTSGARFTWTCDHDGCEIGVFDNTPPPLNFENNDQEAAYSYSWGRFFDICSVLITSGKSGWTSFPAWCRLASCRENRDCPQIYEYEIDSFYECRNGVCQNQDSEKYNYILESDLWSLCFADRPREETKDQLDPEIHLILENIKTHCDENGSNCTVPDGCMVP